ncbi:GlsB/YeaQ/YmgE family stress response membrane protein [Gallaecimonas xiamenensis]|uniref:Transglycosylase n=1 Tax=Gallaecimonas xiamenensis 3-C-1 TaxID=745411 RepID=K2K6G6_9GAMM|nr:GlsB/YeaQ/YmgE family stress response membrane protein [Gallaecimonas xiamenensis]EKE73025.1 transglycosylase [Gallaecimonas xiamenensis 3-C-1]
MGIITWLVLGLVAGILAKWIMPGRDGGGCLVTIALGIAGAFVGGWLGTFMGFGPATGFNLGSIFTAVAGALVLLALYRVLRR